MKVFLAGATGAVGRRLIPLLTDRGHEVVATVRSHRRLGLARELGAEPVVADALDRDAVMAAVVAAEPEVVIHELTALSGVTSVRRWDHEFALTNRLRTEGLDHLLEAARTVGARRFVAESFGNWNYERRGGPVKTKDDPLDPDPPASMARSLAAIRHLEQATLGHDDIEGVVLRYANLYGPGAAMPTYVEAIRARKLPLVGDGAGVWSFVHVDDAAAATALAVDARATGTFNVADDEPAATRVWLPELARALAAPAPRHVPTWLGRLAAGEAGVSLFTRIRGAANGKAKQALGWHPDYPTWREGFRAALAAGVDTTAVAA